MSSATQIISAFDARRKFGDILIGALQGKDYIVQKNGKPIAAVIPIEEYNQQERAREEFFNMMEKSAENAKLSEEEAQALITDAIQAVRKEKNMKL